MEARRGRDERRNGSVLRALEYSFALHSGLYLLSIMLLSEHRYALVMEGSGFMELLQLGLVYRQKAKAVMRKQSYHSLHALSVISNFTIQLKQRTGGLHC